MAEFNIDCSEAFCLFKTDISENSYIHRNAFHSVLNLFAEYYSNLCCKYDLASDLDCMDKQYAIDEPINGFELSSLSLILNCCHHYDKESPELSRQCLQLIGRFLFVHYSELHSSDRGIEPNLWDLGKNVMSFLLCHAWSLDDSIFVRLTIYNMLDSLNLDSKNIATSLISRDVLSEANDISRELILDSINRFVVQKNNIIPIQTEWLYAYIYKKRFGYVFCRKFLSHITKSPLSFTIQTYSIANKGFICRTVWNSSKVNAFEIGEIKRSSAYRPIEDNFLYNFVTMKFE